MLSGILNKDEWSKIGYVVEGNLRQRGSEVCIHRPAENSPNPVPRLWDGDLIKRHIYGSAQEQLDALASAIKEDIKTHGLTPSRQLLVVVLASGYDAPRAEQRVAEGLIERGVTVYVPTAVHANVANPQYPHLDRNRFWCKGAVTVSRVTRAKGNEAEMVYVVGLERVAYHESDHVMRNQLFVALTRARCWVHLSGVSAGGGLIERLFYDELDRVLAAGDTFRFIIKPIVHNIEHEEQDGLFTEEELRGEGALTPPAAP